MQKPKKIPLRKCVVTGERLEKKQLLRVVRTPEGVVIYDPTGKANGRGAYVSKDTKVIEKAKKTNILARHLEVQIPDSLYEELIRLVQNDK
ncbi:MAG: YlxR family protein [Bacilli bacterium]|nr:YlxR family protein [Bacilli bacterium]MBN2697056.1 YlxR family protein [Bacilli bacterium]